MWRNLCIAFVVGTVPCLNLHAEEPASEPAATEEGLPSPADQQERFARFEQALTEVVLVGRYTIVGRDTPAAEERYEIHGISKLSEGDYWMFQCRMQFGDHDLTLPLPLEVKWAGDAPVITVDNVGIPGLGVFSARVIIDGDRYAGTWQHSETGGHLMGVIEPASPEEESSEGNAVDSPAVSP